MGYNLDIDYELIIKNIIKVDLTARRRARRDRRKTVTDEWPPSGEHGRDRRKASTNVGSAPG
jgi:hypothetical protein